MSQQQFTNYQDNILSFELRSAMLGILKPGRYCGFDTVTHNTTSGGIINVRINHTGSGIQKGSKAIPPVLSSKTGVVLTTQGGIIHEDTTNIPIAIDDGSSNGGSTRYDVIYLQHWYLDGTPGSNPATYDIKKGTPGAGIPTLSYPEKQVGLIIVTIPNGVVTFAGLSFVILQKELGDLDISDELMAIIGTRTYSEQNYIANNQTIALSLNALDIILKDKSDLITTLQGTKLDDWATPDNNTDLNASSSRHGLLPMLSNTLTDFLNGQGGWTMPTGRRFKWRTGVPSGDDFIFNVGTGGTQDFDLSSIIADADADLVIISTAAEIAISTVINYHMHGDGETYTTGQQIGASNNSPTYTLTYRQQFLVKMVNRVISVTQSAAATSFSFKVMGWQTAL